jgi:hypothetical protein
LVQIVPSHGTIEPSPLGLGIITTVESSGAGTTMVVVLPPGRVVTVVVGAGRACCVDTFVVVEVSAGACGFPDDPEQPDRSTTNTVVANAAPTSRIEPSVIAPMLDEST